MLAICNANYEFILFDVGAVGRQSNGGVYTNSKIGDAIENNKLDFLNPSRLPNSRRKELDITETIFNYRLSRARRVIENSFGILAIGFRIYRRAIIEKLIM